MYLVVCGWVGAFVCGLLLDLVRLLLGFVWCVSVGGVVDVERGGSFAACWLFVVSAVVVWAVLVLCLFVGVCGLAVGF